MWHVATNVENWDMWSTQKINCNKISMHDWHKNKKWMTIDTRGIKIAIYKQNENSKQQNEMWNGRVKT